MAQLTIKQSINKIYYQQSVVKEDMLKFKTALSEFYHKILDKQMKETKKLTYVIFLNPHSIKIMKLTNLKTIILIGQFI